METWTMWDICWSNRITPLLHCSHVKLFLLWLSSIWQLFIKTLMFHCIAISLWLSWYFHGISFSDVIAIAFVATIAGIIMVAALRIQQYQRHRHHILPHMNNIYVDDHADVDGQSHLLTSDDEEHHWHNWCWLLQVYCFLDSLNAISLNDHCKLANSFMAFQIMSTFPK